MLTGTEPFVDTLRHLGFKDLKDGEYYGYALALGTLDVSLYELTNAYRALANGGAASDLTFTPRVKKPQRRRVFTQEAAFIVSDILSDREARSYTFSLENPLSTRFWSASKTGTSKDMRDNWCVGFSEKYTVGVWVGNFSGEAMWSISGIMGAAPIWHEIMNYLHTSTPARQNVAPANVTAHLIDSEGQNLKKKEWFIQGTEPLLLERSSFTVKPKILYPAEGLIIAIDPDIPSSFQRVIFEATKTATATRWVLNGAVQGEGTLHPWHPAGGTYTLRLVDYEMRTLDQVSFTVRE
jgi:penicillin-binding protein 1C